jgi:hypothetical protein
MLQRACDARKELEIHVQGRKQTCHHAGPGMVKRKKLRVLQTMERVLPGAIGTLKEHMSSSHFFSPIKGSFTGISILQPCQAQCLRTSLHKYASTNQTAPPISSCIYFSLTIQTFTVSQFKDFLYKSLSLCAKGAPYEICKSFFPRAMKSWQHRTETYLL